MRRKGGRSKVRGPAKRRGAPKNGSAIQKGEPTAITHQAGAATADRVGHARIDKGKRWT